MKISRLLLVLLLFVPALLAAAHAAQPATMRLDYYHTGNATTETFSFDRVVIEPLPWPGNMSKTIDDTNLGNYFFEVRDAASDKVLYSRGFGSIFSEWSRHRRGEEAEPHVLRVAALSRARRAGEDRVEGAARR